MSAIKNADRIVFIDKGQVIEDGTHSELIASKGHYYNMVKSTHNELEKSNDLETLQNESVEAKHSNQRESYAFSPNAAKEKLRQPRDSVEYWKSFKRVMNLVKKDWIFLIIAVISSIVLGFSLPLFAVIFSEMYGVSSINMIFPFIRSMIPCLPVDFINAKSR